MTKQIIFNLSLTFIWVILRNSVTPGTFLFGYASGAFFLYLYYRSVNKSFYLRKVWLAAKLIAVFIKEVLTANFVVLRYVFSPLDRLNPGIIAMEVDFSTDFELVLLTSMITLTPGTLTVEISPDNKVVYIHTLDCSDKEKVIQNIRSKFERRIKEVAQFD